MPYLQISLYIISLRKKTVSWIYPKLAGFAQRMTWRHLAEEPLWAISPS